MVTRPIRSELAGRDGNVIGEYLQMGSGQEQSQWKGEGRESGERGGKRGQGSDSP